MLTNGLMINDGKTEVMLVGTPQQLAKITLDGIKVGDENIVPATSVRNLGVNQDNHLKMDKHVSSLCSRSFYQRYRLRRIRKFLTPQSTWTLVRPPKGSRAPSLQGIFYWALGSQRQIYCAPGLHCILFRAPRVPCLKM